MPLWSFVQDSQYPATTSISSLGTATVKYTVNNNSAKSHRLIIYPQPGVSQAEACQLGPKGSCILTLTISGINLPANGISSGPILCQSNTDGTPNPNQCYGPSQQDSLSISISQVTSSLSISPATLLLSEKNVGINAALTGNDRYITVTNNSSSNSVVNIRLASVTGLPSNTQITANTCVGNLNPNSSCTITITPGNTASAGANSLPCTTGVAPIPAVVTLTADNASSVSSNVLVLGYACQYQQGYVFSIDDTTSSNTSIAGKVVSLDSQAGGANTTVVWSSTGVSASTYSFDSLPGIDELSNSMTTGSPTYNDFLSFFNTTYPTLTALPASAFSACNGSTDGYCNTQNILAFYNEYITHIPASNPPTATPLSDYAAGVCNAFTVDSSGTSPCGSGTTCYQQWYLPAICELNNSSSVGCNVNTEQAIVQNLPQLIGAGCTGVSSSCSLNSHECLAGSYWSSTEGSIGPTTDAYAVSITTSNNCANPALPPGKNQQINVRCVRAISD